MVIFLFVMIFNLLVNRYVSYVELFLCPILLQSINTFSNLASVALAMTLSVYLGSAGQALRF